MKKDFRLFKTHYCLVEIVDHVSKGISLFYSTTLFLLLARYLLLLNIFIAFIVVYFINKGIEFQVSTTHCQCVFSAYILTKRRTFNFRNMLQYF